MEIRLPEALIDPVFLALWMLHGSHERAAINDCPVDGAVLAGCLHRIMVIMGAEKTVQVYAGYALKHKGDGPGGDEPFDLRSEGITVLLFVEGAVSGDVELIGNSRSVLCGFVGNKPSMDPRSGSTLSKSMIEKPRSDEEGKKGRM